MAQLQTTIAGAMKAGATRVTLTAYTAPSVGAIPAPKLLRVDGEEMLIADDTLSPTLSVVRGYNGTLAVAHDVLATAVYGLSSDFTQTNDTRGANVTSIGQNTATITLPQLPSNIELFVLLNKATALGTTNLPAPNLDQDGQYLTISTSTAAGHVLTATSLIADGVSGSPHSTLTWAAFKGASITLQADRGLWNVISATGVTVS